MCYQTGRKLICFIISVYLSNNQNFQRALKYVMYTLCNYCVYFLWKCDLKIYFWKFSYTCIILDGKYFAFSFAIYQINLNKSLILEISAFWPQSLLYSDLKSFLKWCNEFFYFISELFLKNANVLNIKDIIRWFRKNCWNHHQGDSSRNEYVSCSKYDNIAFQNYWNHNQRDTTRNELIFCC